MVSWWQVYHSSICELLVLPSLYHAENHIQTPIHNSDARTPPQQAAESKKMQCKQKDPSHLSHDSSLLFRVVCTNNHSHLHLLQLEWLSTQVVAISEKQNPLSFSSGTLRWLDPLAPAGARPQTPQEAE